MEIVAHRCHSKTALIVDFLWKKKMLAKSVLLAFLLSNQTHAGQKDACEAQ